MAFGNMGMGFLPADPRKKQMPTGGSIKAGQTKDTSPVITGDFSGGVGFANPAAFGPRPSSLVAQPKPYKGADAYRQTASERVATREAAGVARSHQNMGALAVDFRAKEKARAERGEQTVQGARDAKILDARAAAEHRYNVLDPAERQAAKFRTAAAGAREFMGKYMANADTILSQGKAKPVQRANSRGLNLGKRSMFSGASRSDTSDQWRGAASSKNTIGPDHSWLIPEMGKEFQEIKDNPDITALGATIEHGEAPSKNPKGWREQAAAQSAEGRATPAALAQMRAAYEARGGSNR